MSRKAGFIPRQVFSSASLTGSYQAFPLPLSKPGIIVKIVNNGTVDVDITTNILGTSNNGDIIPAGGFCLYDLRTNHGTENEFAIPKETLFYIKATAGVAGTGNVYLVVIAELT